MNSTIILKGLVMGLISTTLAAAPVRQTQLCINSLGYLPDRAKIVTLTGSEGNRFEVVEAESGEIVFAGETGPMVRNSDTRESLRILDFTPIMTEGIYFVRLDTGIKSSSFKISRCLYEDSLILNMAGFYGQRCGCDVQYTRWGETWRYHKCHLKDGNREIYDGKNEIKDGVGGWHDAGDYGKYVVNSAFSAGVMLKAWEDFQHRLENLRLNHLPDTEKNKGLPHFLSEIRWELDWLLKMQFEDGKVSHKLTAKNFSGFIAPHQDLEPRYFAPWGTAATASFAAVMAQAARVFAGYQPKFSDICLKAAEKAWEVLEKYGSEIRPDISAFGTGGYQSDDSDDRLWAAGELWETTGDKKYLKNFERRAAVYSRKIEIKWDWNNYSNMGMLTWLHSGREGKNAELQTEVSASLKEACDTIVNDWRKNGYGRGLVPYFWGCNGSVARLSYLLHSCWKITNNDIYLDAAAGQLDHLYGRNYYARSFITGEGDKPPLHPHHRPSGADQIVQPWPGHLVGGARRHALDWIDEQSSYQTNETAINWDAAMTYALAMFMNCEQ